MVPSYPGEANTPLLAAGVPSLLVLPAYTTDRHRGAAMVRHIADSKRCVLLPGGSAPDLRQLRRAGGEERDHRDRRQDSQGAGHHPFEHVLGAGVGF